MYINFCDAKVLFQIDSVLLIRRKDIILVQMPKFYSCLLAIAAAVFALNLAVSCSNFNGTTYWLGRSQVEVFQPINASKFELILTNEADNISMIDSTGQTLEINSSYSFWRGDHIYDLDFGQQVSGNLTYVLPHRGQQFILSLKQNDPVRIVLPPGYATGERLLGIANPHPDELGVKDGRITLTWLNTSKYQMIEVSYYEEKAPFAVKIIFAILATLAFGLLVEYYLSMRRLRGIRDETEKKI
jgi:hypothetical protein